MKARPFREVLATFSPDHQADIKRRAAIRVEEIRDSLAIHELVAQAQAHARRRSLAGPAGWPPGG